MQKNKKIKEDDDIEANIERAKEIMSQYEDIAAQKFEVVTQQLSEKITGSKKVPWLDLISYVTYIYMICTCGVLFYRPDFYNLTICALA